MSTAPRWPRGDRVVVEADRGHRTTVRPHEGWLRRPRRVGGRAKEQETTFRKPNVMQMLFTLAAATPATVTLRSSAVFALLLPYRRATRRNVHAGRPLEGPA